ncbi:fungal-specific transcription factor domain-containing protein [Aspergillus recurvatus]
MALDRRRKFAQRRAEQELVSLRQLIDSLVEAFDKNDLARIGELLSTVREQRYDQGGGQQRLVSSVEESNGENVNLGTEIKSPLASIDSVPDSSRTKSKSESRSRRNSSSFSTSSDSVGSLNEVDTLTEDPNHNVESRAVGYIGKESEIAWMQKLETEAGKLDSTIWEQSPIEKSVTAMSYHIGDLHITKPYHPGHARLLPPRPWAARLVNMFFKSIAPAFPVLHQPLFTSQFNQAYIGSVQPAGRWLAVLNLVLAASARYYQLTNLMAGKDVDDHIFLSRATTLATSHNLSVEHADLQQVQIDILLAIYYLVSGQINRAWQINGRALRSAISLGLNLRALSNQIDPVSKETRARIWWSIFSMEHLLSSMTGRAPCVDYRSMSLYPPVPYDEGHFKSPELQELLTNTQLREERLQWTIYANSSRLKERTLWFQSLHASQSLFFFHHVDLFLITHAAVLAVYSLTTRQETGQSEIPYHQKKLYTWLNALQTPFAFTNKNGELDLDRNSKVQVSLALEYYSSQIILARPCLTRPDIKEGTSIRFPRSRFSNNTAKTCVHSAMALIAVFPETPDTNWILEMTPWWCTLHFIMQALTILLMQISIGPVRNEPGAANAEYKDQPAKRQKQGQGQGPNRGPASEHDLDAILGSSKKALRWLRRMAENDPSSQRAFKISYSFIRRIAKAKGFDMQDVLSPEPHEQEVSRLTSGSNSPSGTWQCSDEATSSRRKANWKLQNEGMNWGPDWTVSESDWDPQQVPMPFVLDPTLFSADM